MRKMSIKSGKAVSPHCKQLPWFVKWWVGSETTKSALPQCRALWLATEALFCPSPLWQFSLLSEVRGLVTPQDLERFDGLVLRREIQALKARQGAAGASAVPPDSLSMVSYPDTLTSSSASFMTNTTLSSARVRFLPELSFENTIPERAETRV